MVNALVVAKELYNEYFEKTGTHMDEMKMHKLMYFVQRESFIVRNVALFDENFYGWKFGPVLKSVRSAYMNKKGSPFKDIHGELNSNDKKLLETVLERYGTLSSWKLSSLSHGEFSWISSRSGLKPSENGDTPMKTSAIKIDAIREKSNRRKQTVD